MSKPIPTSNRNPVVQGALYMAMTNSTNKIGAIRDLLLLEPAVSEARAADIERNLGFPGGPVIGSIPALIAAVRQLHALRAALTTIVAEAQQIKVPLILSDDDPTWANVERTAVRVAASPPWKRGGDPPLFIVRLTCCGRADDPYGPVPWSEADEFREAYLSGPGVRDRRFPHSTGHDRSAIIVANAPGQHPDPTRPGE